MIQFLSLMMISMIQPKPTLIYIGDPMCSWCYGVSEEMSQVKNHFIDITHFELVMGGLRPYNTQVMSELKEFLTHHWDDVHTASNQPFNYEILDSSNITYDTEPPCRANVIVRSIKPDKSFDFFKATQQAFYKENKNMHLAKSYEKALEQIGIPFAEFEKAFNAENSKTLVRQDFEYAAQLGARSFPTLILKKGDEYHLIAQGYLKAEKMIQKIEQHLN